jgi:hypothetical protein
MRTLKAVVFLLCFASTQGLALAGDDKCGDPKFPIVFEVIHGWYCEGSVVVTFNADFPLYIKGENSGAVNPSQVQYTFFLDPTPAAAAAGEGSVNAVVTDLTPGDNLGKTGLTAGWAVMLAPPPATPSYDLSQVVPADGKTVEVSVRAGFYHAPSPEAIKGLSMPDVHVGKTYPLTVAAPTRRPIEPCLPRICGGTR